MKKPTPSDSRTKVGLITPCLGVGGGDLITMGMITHCHGLDITGVAVVDDMETRQIQYFNNLTGNRVPIWQQKYKGRVETAGVNYADFPMCVYNTCRDADIILTWGVGQVWRFLGGFDKPLVELAQNEDEHYEYIVGSNEPDYRVACSKAAAKVFGKDKKVDVIYNAIEPSRVVPRFGREATRQAWGLEGKKIILFMGRFVEEKNPAGVIQALSKLPEEWVGVFVGKGYCEEQLTREAQRHAPDRTFFVPPQYHVGDILAAADCYLLCSDFEGHPLAACEAWLAGTPTVISELDVIQELQEEAGPLTTTIPKRASSEEIASAILYATSSDSMAVARVQNAKSVVWHNFTMPTIALQWEETLERYLFDWRQKKRRIKAYQTPPAKPLTVSQTEFPKK